jgi:hypothetical protein
MTQKALRKHDSTPNKSEQLKLFQTGHMHTLVACKPHTALQEAVSIEEQ